MNMASGDAPAAFGSINQSSVPVGAGAASNFGQRTNYGFTGGLYNQAQRGSNLVMQATNDVSAESSSGDKENLLDKPMT